MRSAALVPRHRASPGFTMIEILVVMAIMGILAAAVMPLGETLVRVRKERELKQALQEIRSALDEYKKASDLGAVPVGITGSGYPPDLDTLVTGLADLRPQNTGKRLYFLRRIPRDPFADPASPPAQTWLLRSFASPPDRPQPGADVYDVRSSSNATALDGSRYSQW
jgi:general secretion pathway protein G